jgi:hypothetical protein
MHEPIPSPDGEEIGNPELDVLRLSVLSKVSIGEARRVLESDPDALLVKQVANAIRESVRGTR